MELTKNNDKQQRQGRIIFLLMTFFFAVPVLVVVAMVKFNWKPIGQSHGELISPPRLLHSTASLKSDNAEISPEFWQDKWNMVYVTKACTQNCLDKLHTMRQLHVSLYKDMPRAQRVLITTDHDITDIHKKYPDIVVINQPPIAVEALSRQFDLRNTSGNTNIKESGAADENNRLYLVDPLGHIVMSYRPETTAQDIRKDLVRLLKYSWAA